MSPSTASPPRAAGPYFSERRAAEDAAGTIRYVSTRAPSGPAVPFGEAMLRGLAPDGGLYLPERLPALPPGWEGSSSPAELAAAVLPPLLEGDGNGGEERSALAAALRQALYFPWPVTPLSDERYLLELFHGPTAAFKDVGARALAQLMDRELGRRHERAWIVVATSGDTGSAVAEAFAGSKHARVALLYPEGGVSEVQERQLVARREGVRAFRVRGTFDDCQRMVKGVFADPALADLRLSSANSINVGRLLPQALYYLWGAREVARLRGARHPLRIVVPSGNLGNLTAGTLAEGMGLEVDGFVAAHNANDYFARYLRGEVRPYDFEASVATYSNAMDVGAPSNFERLIALFGDRLREKVRGVAVDDAATLERIRRTYDEDGVMVCPHTAVGLEALARLRASEGRRTPTLVLATAHPAKFPDVVERAVGQAPPLHPDLEALRRAERRVEPLQADAAALRDVLLAWADHDVD